MGKAYYFWYPFVRECIRHYNDKDDSPMALHMKHAVRAALAQTAEVPDGSGPDRILAVRLLLIDQTYTFEGAACQLSVSRHTAQRYAASFIYLTAAYAGFPTITWAEDADLLPAVPPTKETKGREDLNAWSVQALTPQTTPAACWQAARLRLEASRLRR